MFNSPRVFHPSTAYGDAAGFGSILRGAIILIQCQLREKSAVFLMGALCVAGSGIDRFYRSGVLRKTGDWTV